jgi:hypothetical protein
MRLGVPSREDPVEFYFSFHQLLGQSLNPLFLIFLPVFLFATVFEGVIIWRRQGAYPWKNASVSIAMAVGHFISQPATRRLYMVYWLT